MNGATKKLAVGAIAFALAALGAWFVSSMPTLPDRQAGGRQASQGVTEQDPRSEIIHLAERGALSDGEKKWLFERLSGEQFRAYRFNERERVLILKAIGS